LLAKSGDIIGPVGAVAGYGGARQRHTCGPGRDTWRAAGTARATAIAAPDAYKAADKNITFIRWNDGRLDKLARSTLIRTKLSRQSFHHRAGCFLHQLLS
jgi:hypothetical protein